MMDFITNIGLALLLGVCVGLERQLRQRMAGLRTNALVAVGAAVFMEISCDLGGEAQARIASYIVSGIGFLGAGVILKDGASIRGLNTAATLWCTAAIGAFCGLGYIYEPVAGTAFVVGIHLLLRPLSAKLTKISSIRNTDDAEGYHYRLTARCKEKVENHIRVLLVQYIGNNDNLMLGALSSLDTPNSVKILIEADVISLTKQDSAIEKIAASLTLEEGVTFVKWEISDTHL